MTIKSAAQRIHETHQRLAAIDHEMANLRRQSRRAAKNPNTRVELLAMREQSARLGEERIKANAELVDLIALAEMAPERMGWA